MADPSFQFPHALGAARLAGLSRPEAGSADRPSHRFGTCVANDNQRRPIAVEDMVRALPWMTRD